MSTSEVVIFLRVSLPSGRVAKVLDDEGRELEWSRALRSESDPDSLTPPEVEIVQQCLLEKAAELRARGDLAGAYGLETIAEDV